MSTFTVSVTLIHPEQRERSVALDLLVDTGSAYMLLPPDVISRLGLAAPYERRAQLASGERVVYRVGDVHVKLDGEEHTTVFLAGPPGCRALLGAIVLEQFALAADPFHQRLLPAPPAPL